jgi:hypothetical protein
MTSSSSSVGNWPNAEIAAVLAIRYQEAKEQKSSSGMVGPLLAESSPSVNTQSSGCFG